MRKRQMFSLFAAALLVLLTAAPAAAQDNPVEPDDTGVHIQWQIRRESQRGHSAHPLALPPDRRRHHGRLRPCPAGRG